MLKFSEQMGTPQHVATSSSLTAHLRSLSKGDSPVGSPFQNYSSIHSQSRSVSSPSMQSRSPSISNMAALRWVLNTTRRQTIPKNPSYIIGCTAGIAVCLSLQVCPSKVQVPSLLQHLKALLECSHDIWCAIIPVARMVIGVQEPERLFCHHTASPYWSQGLSGGLLSPRSVFI